MGGFIIESGRHARLLGTALAVAVAVGFVLVAPTMAVAENPTLPKALAVAKKQKNLGSGQFNALMRIVKKFPKLKKLDLTKVVSLKSAVMAQTKHDKRDFELIAFSKGGGKTSFIAFRPLVPLSFAERFPKLKNNSALDKVKFADQLELYAEVEAEIQRKHLPPRVAKITDVFFDKKPYTIKLRPGANLFATADMKKADKPVGDMTDFLGLDKKKLLQIKGTYTGMWSGSSVPAVNLTGAFPAAKVNLGKKKKSEIATQFTLRIMLQGALIETAVGGVGRFKFGKQTVDVALEGAVNAGIGTNGGGKLLVTAPVIGKINALPGYRVTLTLAQEGPWEKAFGIPWLTIENYLVAYGMQGAQVYGSITGKTTVGEKVVDLAAVSSAAAFPETLRLIVDDGPNKVGSLALKDFATIFNRMSKAATGKDGMTRAMIDALPVRYQIAGHKKGEGPVLNIDVPSQTIEIQGKVIYMGEEVADVRQGTINAIDGVNIDADIKNRALGPVTFTKATFKAVFKKGAEPLIQISGEKKDPLGVGRTVTAGFKKDSLIFNAAIDAKEALKADYTLKATLTKQVKKPAQASFGVAGNVTSNVSAWLKNTGAGEIKKLLDGLKLDEAHKAVSDAQAEVDSLQKQIDERRKAVSEGKANNENALNKAKERVDKLNKQITFLDGRIKHFKVRIADCNKFKPARRAGCKAIRGPELAWAESRKQTVIAARNIAKGVLEAVKKSLKAVPGGLDPVLASLITARAVAKQALIIAQKSVEGLDKLGDFTVKVVQKLGDVKTIAIKEGHIAGHVGKGKGEFDNPFELDLKLGMFKKEYDVHLAFKPGEKELFTKNLTYLASGVAIVAINAKSFPKALIPKKAKQGLEIKFLELADERTAALVAMRKAAKMPVPKTSDFEKAVQSLIEAQSKELAAARKDLEAKLDAINQAADTELAGIAAPDWKFVAAQKFVLRARTSANCMDRGKGTIQTWDCNTKNAQQIFLTVPSDKKWHQIQHVQSGKCVMVEGGRKKNGTAIVLADCAQAKDAKKPKHKGRLWRQHHRENGWFSLENRHGTKFCLDLTGGGAKNGTKLQLYKCDKKHPNQMFTRYL